jgi:hypothetical protein
VVDEGAGFFVDPDFGVAFIFFGGGWPDAAA